MSVPRPRRLKLISYRRSRSANRGAAAIEFALVFLIFFSVFYAIVAYGLAFLMEQSMTMAAEEGARAVLQNAPNDAVRRTNAQLAAQDSLSWFTGKGMNVPMPDPADDCNDGIPETWCVMVKVNFDNAKYPLVPSLPFLGIRIPDTLSASARVQYIQY